MDNHELDHLRLAYKAAVDRWIEAIREQEDLATSDHSEVAVEIWDQAGFREEEARESVKGAREEYRDALRKVLYNF